MHATGSNGAATLDEDEELLQSFDNVSCAISRVDEEERIPDDQENDDEGEANDDEGEADDVAIPASWEDWGVGELRVTSRRILWDRQTSLAAEGALASFSVNVSCIALHAVSRDPDTFPRPCLYAQLLLDDLPSATGQPAELYFAPADPDALTPLFNAFSRAAALNPDDEDDDEDEDEDMVGISDLETVEMTTQEAMLGRCDAMLTVPQSLDFAHSELNPELLVCSVAMVTMLLSLAGKVNSTMLLKTLN